MRSYYLRKRQAEIDALHGRGDGKVQITLQPPASTKTPPAAESPAPAQDSSSKAAQPSN
jgi:hypothetical protein